MNIIDGENRKPPFLAKNPSAGLPVLELDDGTCIPESLAIIEFFEEQHPTPPMIGTTPVERARTRALERICELGVLSRVAQIFQNTHPFMAGRLKQSAEAADNARAMMAASLKVLDDAIGNQPFVADHRGLHARGGTRLRGVRGRPARPGIQERRPLVCGVQGAPERAGMTRRAGSPY